LRRILLALVLLGGLRGAGAETVTLSCTGGLQPVHFRIGSNGEVVMNGKPYRASSLAWHADVISFWIPIEDRRFMTRATFYQEWAIDRASGEARFVFHARSKALARYRCRDSVTGESKF
jgi:hypothetical protein